MSNGTLAAIHLHPVKSCRRVEVESAVVSATGLEYDRAWQVVGAKGVPVTQRQHKVLATVQPTLIDGGLRISAPGLGSIEFGDPSPQATSVEARSLFGVEIPSIDAGDEAAEWFSSLVGEPVRLAGATAGWAIPSSFGLHDQPMGFVDAAPVLVATTSSLAWLNERATEHIPMNRFRPNLIIDNEEPWAEDTWAGFTVGDAQLRLSLPWPRCAIPQIDQETAVRHGEPARVLKEYRWCTSAPSVPEAARPIVEGNGLFGIGCTIGQPGTTLTVGQKVTVLETTEPILAPPANS